MTKVPIRYTHTRSVLYWNKNISLHCILCFHSHIQNTKYRYLEGYNTAKWLFVYICWLGWYSPTLLSARFSYCICNNFESITTSEHSAIIIFTAFQSVSIFPVSVRFCLCLSANRIFASRTKDIYRERGSRRERERSRSLFLLQTFKK